MQIYADVTGRPMKISRSDQTCALGAAIFGAVAAGREASGYDSIKEIQSAVSGVRTTVYQPNPANRKVYAEMYGLYHDLHDAFGTTTWSGRLNQVMKNMITLREKQRV